MGNWRPDIIVGDPNGAAVMVVEVKGHSLGDDYKASEAWHQLKEAMSRARAPYGLLFSPGTSILLTPEGEEVFDGKSVLDAYHIAELPRFGPGAVAENVAFTWLVDLSLGIARPSPATFPEIVGDDVRRAA